MAQKSRRMPTGTKSENDRIADLEAENKVLRMKKENEKNNSEDERVSPDDYVEVVSLCPTILTLTTEPKGRGFNYTFNNFGDILQIVYADLQRIIKNHGSGLYTDFIREGYVYINSPSVVKKSGLKQIYEKILNREQMEEVISCQSQRCVEMFESTNRRQQLFISEMLIDKMARGESRDLNIIDQYSRIVTLDIVGKSQEAKSYLDMNLKEE